jgi:acetylornithine/succinyldiaminopimelate/putrescine aminotransferase
MSCAAGLVTLKTLLQKNIISRVPGKEKALRNKLIHPMVREIRSAGLLMAMELYDFSQVQRVMRFCLERGVVTDWFLFNDKCLRIAPPLTISEEEISLGAAIICEAMDACTTS